MKPPRVIPFSSRSRHYGWLSNFHSSPISWNNQNFPTAEHLYQYKRAILAEILVSDSMCANIPDLSPFEKIFWPGGTLKRVVQLATICCHSRVKSCIVFAGTNDLPARKPWEEQMFDTKDGAILRTSPTKVILRVKPLINEFLLCHLTTKLFLCDVLPRLCDPPTKGFSASSGRLSKIQLGVVELNQLFEQFCAELRLLPEFSDRICSIPLYHQFTSTDLFRHSHNTPDLHLNHLGSSRLRQILASYCA